MVELYIRNLTSAVVTQSTRFLIIVSLITHFFSSFGQDQLGTSGFNGPTIGRAIMSEEFRVNAPSEGNRETIEFFHVKYKTPTLDLRAINTYTKYTVPESVTVTPPDLSAFDHTTALIGLYGNPNEPKMLIWLAGNYNYNDVTFFVDYDQDRNFTDDRKTLRIRRGKEPVQVILTPKEGDQSFWLGLPEVTVAVKKPKERIEKNLVATFQAGVGSGDLTYSYNGSTSNTSDGYYVNISEKSLGTALSYYMRNFIVGTSLSYQNHYYYASYHIEDGIPNTAVNQDYHGPNKLHLGLYGLYRFRITEFIELQPLFKYGITHYLKPEYKPFKNRDEAYPLGASQFFEIGMRFEFTAGTKNVFFLEYARNRQDWEPRGLPGSEQDSFESRVKISKFSVGFSVPLF
ncbi:MAG: hypothetical protein ABJG78_03140 [Cyclobacteriaceae bacterium]